jgi:hypothetical protein
LGAGSGKLIRQLPAQGEASVTVQPYHKNPLHDCITLDRTRPHRLD